MLSELIFKKTPETGLLFCCHSSCPVHSNYFKICNPPVVGFLRTYQTPTPLLSKKKKKKKIPLKMYVLQCTLYVHRNVPYISDFSKNLSKMFQIYSELCLLTYHPRRYGKESWAGQCRLISERDRPGILIPGCITYRRIFTLKS